MEKEPLHSAQRSLLERVAVMSCVQMAMRQFHCDRIDCICSSRQLFSVSSELLGKSRTHRHKPALLSDAPRSELPQRFCDFFSNKISNLGDDLDSRSFELPTFTMYDGPMLSHFDPVTARGICELIVRSPTKSCMLDPI